MLKTQTNKTKTFILVSFTSGDDRRTDSQSDNVSDKHTRVKALWPRTPSWRLLLLLFSLLWKWLEQQTLEVDGEGLFFIVVLVLVETCRRKNTRAASVRAEPFYCSACWQGSVGCWWGESLGGGVCVGWYGAGRGAVIDGNSLSLLAMWYSLKFSCIVVVNFGTLTPEGQSGSKSRVSVRVPLVVPLCYAWWVLGGVGSVGNAQETEAKGLV